MDINAAAVSGVIDAFGSIIYSYVVVMLFFGFFSGAGNYSLHELPLSIKICNYGNRIS